MQNTYQIVRRYWWQLGVMLCSAIIVLQLYARYRQILWTSDDVVIQNLAFLWFQGLHHLAETGPDNFFLKIPFYWIVQSLAVNGPRTLLITSIFFNLICFIVYASVLRRWIARSGVGNSKLAVISSLLPLAWLATGSKDFYLGLLSPNSRNLEVAIAFLLVGLVLARHKYINFTKSTRIKSLLLVIFTGVFIYSDPYFLYFIFVPLVVTYGLGLLSANKLRPLAEGILLILLSFIAYKVTSAFMAYLHFYISAPVPTIVTLKQFWPQCSSVLLGIIRYFGIILFGQKLISLAGLRDVLNLFVLLIVLTQAVCSALSLTRNSDLWKAYPGIAFLLMPLVLVFISNPDGAVPGRYLIMLPFFAALLLAYAIFGSGHRLRIALVTVLISAISINGLTLARALIMHKPNLPPYPYFSLTARAGAVDGYAHYWVAGISTYLSKGQYNVNPLSCESGRFVYMNWYHDSAGTEKNMSSSFLVLTPQLTDLGCGISEAQNQFGATYISNVNNAESAVLIFPYNIGTRLDQWSADKTR